jgi:hypothetical protein
MDRSNQPSIAPQTRTGQQLLPSLPIRPGMDVFSADQGHYIGTVEAIWHAADLAAAERKLGAGPTTPQEGAREVSSVDMGRHEVERESPRAGHIGSKQSGEEMGPYPTLALGNTGPAHQAAAASYATQPRGMMRGVVYFVVRPEPFNPLAKPLYIPTTAVRSISMERVILDIQKGQIPKEWHSPPALLYHRV